MSLSQKMLDIIDELESRFQAIDGGDDYHNEIDHNLIYMQHMDYQKADAYPSISVSSFEALGSRQTDQVTYDTPLEIEIFGYIEDSSDADKLKTTIKLAQDIEKAIYADEDLGGNIFSLQLDITTATMNEYGIAKVVVKGVMTYAKT